MATVDLNADMGESFGSWKTGDDESLLGIVTSANVACGFHAGDAVVMGQTCKAAAEHGVCIGAHVSYRDLAGFGRNFIDVDPGRLRDEVIYQLSALRGIAAVHGASVRYVKPHGACTTRSFTTRLRPRQSSRRLTLSTPHGCRYGHFRLAGSSCP
ncbi:lactam utilization protein LamB [Cutibacterium acnes JCM 18916]|nr:lactam utilization protein LamB [Cutibacterium acnes JCM 18916]